jgi:hypothetical protein
MRQWLWILWHRDDGQDLVEYSLLLAAIICLTMGFIAFAGQSIKGIVNRSTSQLSVADQGSGF